MYKRILFSIFAVMFMSEKMLPQYTIKNDKLYLDYIIIWFRSEVVVPVGNNRVSLTDQIKPQFGALKAKMNSYGPLVLESVFPGKRWGDTLATNDQGQIVSVPEMSQVFKIIFSSPIEDVKAEEIIQSLSKFPEVINVVYPSVPVSQLDPIDPQYTPTTQWNLYKIRAGGSFGAWEITTGNKSNNTVAIIDDGVPDSDNEDLFGKASSGGETTPDGTHASRVGGVVGAATNNNKGIASLGWNIKFTPFMWGDNTITAQKIVAAANLSYVKVINCSWYLTKFVGTNQCTLSTETDLASTIGNAVTTAIQLGKTIVAGMGNAPGCNPTSRTANFTIPYLPYPAAYPNVLAVTATDQNDQFATGFNYGPPQQSTKPDLSAPGKDIRTTGVGATTYVTESGTSMAAPHVSALVALMLDVNPGLPFAQIRTILQTTPVDLPLPGNGRDNQFGYGRIDAYRAVREAIPTPWIQASSNPAFPTFWSAISTITNTGRFITNADRQNNYPQSYAALASSITLNNTTLVIEKKTWLYKRGYSMTLQNGSRIVIEPESEIFPEAGDLEMDASSGIAFQGAGSCVGMRGGRLHLLDNAVLNVSSGGILASFTPSTIELGANAKIIIDADGYLKWFANSNIIMGSGAAIEVYGTVEVGDNVILSLPPGSNFNLHPGAQMKMGTNALISIQGTFHAIGTAQSPIVFQGNPPQAGATWNGIVFQSGSNGEIGYANISNAQYGIQCDGALPSIHNNTIAGNSIGLYVNNLGKQYGGPLIASNVIESNTYYGVYLYNSSPQLDGNTVRNNGYDGIYCDWYSAPVLSYNTVTGNQYAGLVCRFFSPAYLGAGPGWNRITGNNQGVLADYESHAWLYYNSVFANTGYEITAAYNSFVSARSNWWGAYPPDNGEFLATSGGSIDYGNALSWDPTGGGQQNMIGGKSSPPSQSLLGDDEMSRALQFQLDRRYDDAIAIYDSVLQSGLRTAKARIALARMNECYAGARRRDFVQYLDARIRPRLTRNEELMGRTIELENHWLVTDGQFARALANLNRIRREFSSNRAMVKHALFRPVIILLKHLRDLPRAQAAFAAFVASYPNDPLVEMGRVLLEIESQRPSGISKPNGEQLSHEKLAEVRSSIPTSFELHQNYPNPFNPTTTIRFAIPQNERVTLRVYDLLGREVATLVDESREAGSYDQQFDASQLSSGLYIYKLTAGSFLASKKLMVVK